MAAHGEAQALLGVAREALAALDTLLIRTREQTLGIERSGLLDEGMPPVDPAKERTSTG